eukprot:TRINITY_DN7305_c0_g1_i1.p1 TRINITY_DN7305_c0_g1~~TRINITY_DN7305_c0_g1_i1.p1  ORF type:complete len:126 (+),score=11.38 TRINITY_DN7305_c0_g1_i1:367-744(+)
MISQCTQEHDRTLVEQLFGDFKSLFQTSASSSSSPNTPTAQGSVKPQFSIQQDRVLGFMNLIDPQLTGSANFDAFCKGVRALAPTVTFEEVRRLFNTIKSGSPDSSKDPRPEKEKKQDKKEKVTD